MRLLVQPGYQGTRVEAYTSASDSIIEYILLAKDRSLPPNPVFLQALMHAADVRGYTVRVSVQTASQLEARVQDDVARGARWMVDAVHAPVPAKARWMDAAARNGARILCLHGGEHPSLQAADEAAGRQAVAAMRARNLRRILFVACGETAPRVSGAAREAGYIMAMREAGFVVEVIKGTGLEAHDSGWLRSRLSHVLATYPSPVGLICNGVGASVAAALAASLASSRAPGHTSLLDFGDGGHARALWPVQTLAYPWQGLAARAVDLLLSGTEVSSAIQIPYDFPPMARAMEVNAAPLLWRGACCY